MYTNLNLKDFSFEMHGFNDTLGDNTFIVIQFNQFKDSNTKINTECLKKNLYSMDICYWGNNFSSILTVKMLLESYFSYYKVYF